MKKVLAILSIVALASCNGNGASSDVLDSTKVEPTVIADTVAVVDTLLKNDTLLESVEVDSETGNLKLK
jgi:hypothetical protein